MNCLRDFTDDLRAMNSNIIRGMFSSASKDMIAKRLCDRVESKSIFSCNIFTATSQKDLQYVRYV